MRNLHNILGLSVVATLLSGCYGPYVSVQPKDDPNTIMTSLHLNQRSYDIGKKHLKASSYGLAIEAFRHDIQTKGQSVESLNGLAITYDLLGRYDLSQKYYEQAILLNKAQAFTYNNFALSQYQQKNYDDARLLIAKAQDLYRYKPEQTQVVTANNQLIETSKVTALARHLNTQPIYKPERTKAHEWTIRKQSIISDKNTLNKTKSVISKEKLNLNNKPRVKWFDEAKYRIRNGTGRYRMALRFSKFLGLRGIDITQRANANHYEYKTSLIEYKPGFEEAAKAFAKHFTVPVELKPSQKHPADVTLTLGADMIEFDKSLSQPLLAKTLSQKGGLDDKS